MIQFLLLHLLLMLIFATNIHQTGGLSTVKGHNEDIELLSSKTEDNHRRFPRQIFYTISTNITLTSTVVSTVIVSQVCFSTPAGGVILPCRRRRSPDDVVDEEPLMFDEDGAEVKIQDIISVTKVQPLESKNGKTNQEDIVQASMPPMVISREGRFVTFVSTRLGLATATSFVTSTAQGVKTVLVSSAVANNCLPITQFLAANIKSCTV